LEETLMEKIRQIIRGNEMTEPLILVNRETLSIELRKVFDRQTTDILLNVLDQVASQVHAAGVPREDFTELKQLMAEIAATQQQIQKELAELAAMHHEYEKRMQHIEGDVAVLKTDMKEVKTDIGKLKGHYLETRYRDRAPSFFGRWLRRPKAIDVNKLWDDLEKSLTEEEFEALLALDLIVTGKLKHQSDGQDVYLAIEVSATIDRHDVERACQRAQLLQKAGYRAIPVVAGEKLADDTQDAAAEHGVVIVQDGLRLLWDEALARWISAVV
jgi:hypothetical protein